MFTGIVETLGTVKDIERHGTAQSSDVRLRIEAPELPMAEVATGDSIAVNGVCLTALDFGDNDFAVDVSGETLSLTSIGALESGARVNLERALTLQKALGGHLVTGHVDALAAVSSRKPAGRSERFEFEMPPALARFFAVKGSACVDGVSLTVNDISKTTFAVNLIPHTLSVTTLGDLAVGDRVNLEVDTVARYLDRLLEARER